MKPISFSLLALVLVGTAYSVRAQQNPAQQRGNSSAGSDITIAPIPGGGAFAATLRQVDTLVLQGMNAVKQGKDAQAEALFRKALTLNNDGRAWLSLAEIYDRQNKPDAALKAYRTLIYPQGWGSSISSSPNTRLHYVLALVRSHQWQAAVDVYNMTMHATTATNGHPLLAQQFDPRNPDWEGLEAVAHLGLGITAQAFRPRDPAEQIKHLQAAVRLQPHLAPAQYYYGKALEEAGRTKEAQAAYTRVLDLQDTETKAKAEQALSQLMRRPK